MRLVPRGPLGSDDKAGATGPEMERVRQAGVDDSEHRPYAGEQLILKPVPCVFAIRGGWQREFKGQDVVGPNPGRRVSHAQEALK